jgi:hypothetical protein
MATGMGATGTASRSQDPRNCRPMSTTGRPTRSLVAENRSAEGVRDGRDR